MADADRDRDDGAPRPVLERVVRETGAQWLVGPLIALVVLTVLAALAFGSVRWLGRSRLDEPAEIAWMQRAAPWAIALAAASIAGLAWYVRRTRHRLTVLLERSEYVLVIEGRRQVRARGPFEVARGFGIVRHYERGTVIEAALGIAREGGPVAVVTEKQTHRPPEDWEEGPIAVHDEPVFEVVGKPCLIELADKLGSGAAGAIDEGDVEWIAEALRSGKRKKKKKISQGAG